VLATAVVVPAAWYLVRLFQGVFNGHQPVEGHIAGMLRRGQFADLSLNEFFVLLPLLALIFYIGFQPWPFVTVLEPSVVNTLQHALQSAGSAFK
jgi:NADH-quinone oxidoreductase subunit M